MSLNKLVAGRDTLAGRLTRTLILWVGGVWLLCVFAVVWYVDREINHNFETKWSKFRTACSRWPCRNWKSCSTPDRSRRANR